MKSCDSGRACRTSSLGRVAPADAGCCAAAFGGTAAAAATTTIDMARQHRGIPFRLSNEAANYAAVAYINSEYIAMKYIEDGRRPDDGALGRNKTTLRSGEIRR